MNNNELLAGTKDEQRTAADSSTSASVEASPMLADAVQEGNKLIAVFMNKLITHSYESFGKRYTGTIHPNNVKDWSEVFMPYNSNWNKLIPAWKKFYKEVILSEWYQDESNEVSNDLLEKMEYCLTSDLGIESAFYYFVEFIKWYNVENNKSA